MRALLLSLILLLPLSASAAVSASAAEFICPPGNLLRGKTPVAADGVIRPEVLTNSQQPFDGAFWDSPHTSIFISELSFVVYDLGEATSLAGLHLQADNNDTFEISSSLDGREFVHLMTLPSMPQGGMQTRAVSELARPLRFLRIGNPKGDGYFSIGEVQLYCRLPQQWPAPVPLVGAPPEAAGAPALDRSERSEFDRWWADREVRLSVHKSVIGALTILAFLGLMWQSLRGTSIGWLVAPAGAASALGYAVYQTWGVWALLVVALLGAERLWWVSRQQGKKSKAWQATSDRGVLLVIMLVGSLTWTNFLTFHGSREVHLWDFMHYYVGSKYFAENDFEWLYHCALQAEVDDGRGDEVMRRKYRSLKDNRLGPASLIAEEAKTHCRASFSDERWQAFRQDLRIFRDLMSPGWFKDAFHDHGYNATPVWTAAGSTISNWGWRDAVPPPDLVFSPKNLAGKTKLQVASIQRRFIADRDRLYSKVKWLARIDLALYAGIFALISWAFGLRAGALAIAMWSVGHPWAYYWTGGSFGRAPWLFMSVAGLCLMKKGHASLAGAGIAWAILLRAFPGSLALGLALKFAWNAIRQRRIDAVHGRIIAGAAAATLVLATIGGISAGFDAYSGFLANSIKHQSTPLTNHMGLRTLVSYDPRYTAKHMRNHEVDPYADWKEKRRSLLDDRSLLFAALILGGLALVGAYGRDRPDWETVAISTLLLFGIFELTSYYFSYLVILAPLCARQARYAVAFIAMAIATQLSSLSIVNFDEIFLLDSAIILALLLFVIGSELRQGPRLEPGKSRKAA